MIEFKSLNCENKAAYDAFLLTCGERGCEYNFANLFLWGRQRAAFYEDSLVFFSQFNRKSVYLFPLTRGDLKPALDAIIHDAKVRDIPCRLTGLLEEDCATLEKLYPGRFRFHVDRNGFDYIYAIEELAELKGRKFQRKRNHLNRFRQNYDGYTVEPITDENTPEVVQLLDKWYADRLLVDPDADFIMEQNAIYKALRHRSALGMEGLVLRHNGQLLAMTMGSPLSGNSFDVQFEKALDFADGAYPAICWEFTRYLRAKYPELQWLNREDDLGIEGLRKAKLAYCPDHMIEKRWACLLEDGCDY